jgi:hypothetical protein
MEVPYRPPNILRLTGITLADFVPIEDVADQNWTSAADDIQLDDDAIHPPDKIPRTFTGLEDWPHTTNLRCWQCDFTFDDRPKFIPTYVCETEDDRIEFGVLGNMCTFNCAELWIITNYAGKEEQQWRAQDNLRLVYFLFTGRHVDRIKPAINKTELKKYGGELDEETFLRRMRDLDPIAGLKDHTPGTVIPDRDRKNVVIATIRPPTIRTRRIIPSSVWAMAGAPTAVAPPPVPAPAPPPASTLTNEDVDELFSELGI